MNTKGGAMVEATVVFPIIILTLMSLISIMMFLFEDAASQADLHNALRCAAGQKTGTYFGSPGSSRVSMDTDYEGIYRVMKGRTTVMFEGDHLLRRSFQKPMAAYLYLTDERKYARIFDFFAAEEQEGDGNHDTTYE